MSNTNPARGMRDFLPEQVRRRDHVIGVIREVYEKYGFEPLETPAAENLSTLTNKYGEEGDQLMFKILERGEKIRKKIEEGKIERENDLADLALRYDLTVPLARVIANYRHELPRFFRRYQIQPVWRADRPARGRYREFYQCDVDAIGSRSVVVEIDICEAVCDILEELGFEDYEIRVNHRSVLFGLISASGIEKEKAGEAVVALDKLDKIGAEKVAEEMVGRGIDRESAEKLVGIVGETDSEDRLSSVAKIVANDGPASEGISNLKDLFAGTRAGRVKFDPSLARGLSYYTGVIMEAVLTDGDFSGSIGGGGRYDELIGMFGKEPIPAAGFSIGLERIILIMEERNMFPKELPNNSADVLVALWSMETLDKSMEVARIIRDGGIRAFLYPQPDKLAKQIKYADQIGARVICILGESEIETEKVTIKNLANAEQRAVSLDGLVSAIKELE
ncbi:MAG: histidine--tRNA ligase [Pyrinomonadaceae bacterium]